jgi:hypothetical protein
MTTPRRIPDPSKPTMGARLAGEVTPGRIAVLVAFGIALIVIGYAARIDQSDTQLPLLITGFVLLGLVFLTLAAWGCLALIRAGGDDDGRTAFFAALLGGLCAIAAAGTLGGAVVLALIWKTTA